MKWWKRILGVVEVADEASGGKVVSWIEKRVGSLSAGRARRAAIVAWKLLDAIEEQRIKTGRGAELQELKQARRRVDIRANALNQELGRRGGSK